MNAPTTTSASPGKAPDDPVVPRHNILVVENHRLVCEAFAELINSQENFFCCGMAFNLHEAQRVVSMRRPDLVVLNVPLDDADAERAVRTLLIFSPGLRILVVTSPENFALLDRARKAGALACLTLDETMGDLCRAIQAILPQLPPGAAKTARPAPEATPSSQPPQNAGLLQLTIREMLFYICARADHPLFEIAAELHLNGMAVELLRRAIAQKLRVPAAHLTQPFSIVDSSGAEDLPIHLANGQDHR